MKCIFACMSLSRGFSTKGAGFAFLKRLSPGGKGKRGGAAGTLWGKAKHAAKHLTTHRTSSATIIYLVHNVS